MSAELDLRSPLRIHIVGVGGAGMSAIAEVLAGQGHKVSGSDLHGSRTVDRLRRSGITVAIGHDAANVRDVDLVTSSPAVQQTNPELEAARSMQISIATRGEVLAAIVRLRRTLAIAGTHGKTTTSSMLALIAREHDRSPSFMVGEALAQAGSNAWWGSDPLLILEADESYGTFATMVPAIVGITNVEPDHLDHYGTEDVLESAFRDLLERATEGAVLWADDPGAARVAQGLDTWTIGTTPGVKLTVTRLVLGRASSSFSLDLPDGSSVGLVVAAPGLHNVANASVAAVVANVAWIAGDDITSGLGRFTGVPRRYEFRGTASGVTFVDDYAHLPTEVASTVAAATAGGFDRRVVLFQPHRYTRIANVGTDFARSFEGADVVVVTSIYPAGETPIAGVTSRIVTEVVTASGTVDQVLGVDSLDDAVDVALPFLIPGTLCLTLGAGDSTSLPDRLLARLEQR
ncbi:MAG: UDP-N-acetylmuramate--L-alanine ligase [Actinomycetota bacterium]